jgi:hypothetical protein
VGTPSINLSATSTDKGHAQVGTDTQTNSDSHPFVIKAQPK